MHCHDNSFNHFLTATLKAQCASQLQLDLASTDAVQSGWCHSRCTPGHRLHNVFHHTPSDSSGPGPHTMGLSLLKIGLLPSTSSGTTSSLPLQHQFISLGLQGLSKHRILDVLIVYYCISSDICFACCGCYDIYDFSTYVQFLWLVVYLLINLLYGFYNSHSLFAHFFCHPYIKCSNITCDKRPPKRSPCMETQFMTFLWSSWVDMLHTITLQETSCWVIVPKLYFFLWY